MVLSAGGAAFYFMTDTPSQYPEGPHFTPIFYNSVIGSATWAGDIKIHMRTSENGRWEETVMRNAGLRRCQEGIADRPATLKPHVTVAVRNLVLDHIWPKDRHAGRLLRSFG